ncbi:hypothetical protein EV145_11519 [Flavobacterium sp. 245]|jgi:hypothetical protein|nr:hypothetical protein EV145_11519 [Flavobacterium sp. 245]
MLLKKKPLTKVKGLKFCGERGIRTVHPTPLIHIAILKICQVQNLVCHDILP